jgi:hypothetical protein
MSLIAVEDARPTNQKNQMPGRSAAKNVPESARRSNGQCRLAAAVRLALGGGRAWLLALAALLPAATGAQAQGLFSTPEPVGSTAGPQTVVVQSPGGGTVATVEVLTLGQPTLDFAPGASGPSCGSAVIGAGGSCSQSVTFTPAYPGPRIGAVVLLDSGGHVLGTAYLAGTGSGGLGIFTPGTMQTAAGDGQWTSVLDGKLATAADLDLPSSVAIDGAGNMYIADSAHNRIRKVAAPVSPATVGLISTICGNGNPAFSGDGGPAASATLNSPSGITIDGAGNLYIADTGNNRVREIVAATGIITTVAGDGDPGTASSVGDGLAATAANLNAPWGVTLDIGGNLFIADTFHHRVRKVDVTSGLISTVAGTGFTYADGSGTYSGDGGQATAARLSFPYAVLFDPASNMYIPDAGNNRVRKVDTSGVITTFAGNGVETFGGDGGLAVSASLYSPSGLAMDPAGNLYIADTQNNRIRKVSAATLDISTIAGSGSGIYGGDNGSAANASIYGPYGLLLDVYGNLFIADYFDHRIREIQGNLAMLDFTKTPVRQGDTSTPQSQTVENDGSAALDLSAITPDQNSALDKATTTCAIGSPFLAVNADCAIGAEFAPSVAGDPLIANIDITGATPNSPLDIQLTGNATAVNSTTIAVTSNINPSNFGQSVIFTATVTTGSSTGNLTGTVSFFDGATTLAANIALNTPSTTATATFATAALAVGVHQITASYSGDSKHFASNSTDNSTAPYPQTVLEATATGLTSSANPSATGQNVTFTATVAISGGGGVTPDGTVTFTDTTAGTILGTQPLGANGTASVSTAKLTSGVHSIIASYGGDAANQILGSASSALSQDVQASSSTVVGSSGSPSVYGNPVTFTATVTPSGSAPATGTVNFLDGGKQIGTGALAGATGQATYTNSSLAVGSHTITAAYQGDTNYSASTSAAITQVVNQTQTATSVVAVPDPGIAGKADVLTATVKVTQGVATPTKTVTFTDGTVTLGTATLGAAGTATINPILAPGPHSIVATYGGDTDDGSSASAALPLTVVLATTQTALTSTPNPSVVLAPVAFTAKVTGNGGIPTGSVIFYSDGTSIGTGTLDATGTATLNYSGLSAGTHSITASYGGDADDSPSTSAAISQVVGTIPTVTDLGTSTTTGPNPQVILVATVLGSSGPAPTGTVTFTSGSTQVGTATLDSSGVATLTPNLATGNYTIVAAYGGDALHSPSTSQPVQISSTAVGFNLTVTPASVTMQTKQNATVTVALTSNSGFTDTIGMGCASLPAGVTCHFSSISVDLKANATQNVQLTIDTNNPLSGGTSAMNSHLPAPGVSLAGLFLPLGVFLGWIVWRFRRRHGALLATLLFLLLSGATMTMSGCSGFSQSSAAPGTYVIQVTGAGANSDIIHYQNVTLNITK